MKKLLAVVLALVMMLTLSVVAFATTPDPVDTDETKTYPLGQGDIELKDADPDRPGNVYYFTILDDTDNTGYLTDDEIAKHLTVSVKEQGAKVLESASIVKKGGVYKVKITTKETYTTSTSNIEWLVTLKKNKTKVVSSTKILFREKWASVTADRDADEDAYYDVILKEATKTVEGVTTDLGAMYAEEYAEEQNIEALVKLFKGHYNEVLFGDTGFWYSVKMNSDQTINAYWTTDFNKLYQFFEDADVTGVFLKGTPNVDAKGTFHASFDDDMFVYAVTSADGKLEDLFKWNKEAECWEYNTRAIYGAIVSDTKLDIEAWNKTLTGDASSTTESKGNPGTGSVDFVNLAVALGVVSLAAAGAVVLKRK